MVARSAVAQRQSRCDHRFPARIGIDKRIATLQPRDQIAVVVYRAGGCGHGIRAGCGRGAYPHGAADHDAHVAITGTVDAGQPFRWDPHVITAHQRRQMAARNATEQGAAVCTRPLALQVPRLAAGWRCLATCGA